MAWYFVLWNSKWLLCVVLYLHIDKKITFHSSNSFRITKSKSDLRSLTTKSANFWVLRNCQHIFKVNIIEKRTWKLNKKHLASKFLTFLFSLIVSICMLSSNKKINKLSSIQTRLKKKCVRGVFLLKLRALFIMERTQFMHMHSFMLNLSAWYRSILVKTLLAKVSSRPRLLDQENRNVKTVNYRFVVMSVLHYSGSCAFKHWND